MNPTTVPTRGTVLAAIDGADVARRVLAVATALGHAMRAPVRAVHVVHDGIEAARAAAGAAGVHLQCLEGDPADALGTAMTAPDVALLVLGSRDRPTGPTPAGSVAIGVLQQVDKPVVVVPPTCTVGEAVARVLVPLEGTQEAAAAVASITARLEHAGMEVVVLHVIEAENVPACLDQPHHALESWEHEFMTRFTEPDFRMVLRRGDPEECIPRVAAAEDVDLVVLGWSQQLSAGHARVVRRLLADSSVPLVLAPGDATRGEADEHAARPGRTGGRAA